MQVNHRGKGHSDRSRANTQNSYGAHAKSVIPELTRLGDYFEKDEKDFPKNLMLVKAKSIGETIAAIEASTDSPELIRIK